MKVKKIKAFGSHDIQRVWPGHGKAYKEKCLLLAIKFVDWRIIVWRCMSSIAPNKLHFIYRIINAEGYCNMLKENDILDLFVIYMPKYMGHACICQHNDEKYIIIIVRGYIKENNMKACAGTRA